MQKISVFIIAKNEEDRIGKSISSVLSWVDEVIVIDSGSTDNTVQICKDFGATVIFNKWSGYGQQKIFGEKSCKYDYILNIDADEEISPELKKEILVEQKKGFDFCAYRLRFKSMFVGQKKPNLFAHINDPIRLYNKHKAGFKNSTVHDSVVTKLPDGKIGKFKNIVYHRTFRNLSHYNDKMQSYTTMQAKDMFKKGKKYKTLRIIFEPPFAFFKSYVIRRNFAYGLKGFMISKIYAYGRVIRQIKLYDLYNKTDVEVLHSDESS